jgi:glycosyltransferase involved in cell wall biosynthesis
MVCYIHPAINAYSRSTGIGLEKAGLLSAFWTTIASFSDTRANESWRQRELPIFMRGHVYTKRAREVVRLIATRLGLGKIVHQRGSPFSVDAVYAALSRSAAAFLEDADNCKAVYATEDAALEAFHAGRHRGLKCVYELPIGHYATARRIYEEERERCPAFAGTLAGLSDPPEKLARKEQELATADAVMACSDFVRDTCVEQGIPGSKVHVISYGAPRGLEPRKRVGNASKPLKVLFVGGIGQRKGLSDLLDGVRQFRASELELHLMGPFVGNAEEVLLRRGDAFVYHAPAGRGEVLRLMSECDVFVLPSLFEGLAMVVLEAMACGLPAVITPNTGATRFVKEGQTGWNVPIRRPDAIEEILDWCLKHRRELAEMGMQAARDISSRTWHQHGEELADWFRQSMNAAR